ncbi:MAG: NnrU family protein [Burkholderiales bacterium]
MALILGMLGFVGGHLVLAWPPIRTKLVGVIGERGFAGIYSVLAAASLGVAISGYRSFPSYVLWNLGTAGRAAPALLMPVALMLVVLGVTSRNATAVGGEKMLAQGAAPRGIFTVTRHPFLWGVGLWAIAHLFANGDLGSLILFGGMALLAFAGMAAIDYKRAVRLGAAWDRFAAQTSLVPFAAAFRGRVIDWGGIGWVRPVAALLLYIGLLHGHRLLFGVSGLPRPPG